MSVRHSAWVWDHSKAEGGALLVALALADSVNALGGEDECYPKIERLMSMTRLSARQVTRCLRDLEGLGEIETQRTQNGNRYRLLVPDRTSCPVDAHVRSDQTPTSDPDQTPTSDPYVEPEVEPEIEPEALGLFEIEPEKPKSEAQIASDEIWTHYQKTIPNGSRYKLTDRRSHCIKRALAVRTVDECKRAISGLAVSDYHLDGGYLDIEYALGLRSEDPDGRIDKMAAKLSQTPASSVLSDADASVFPYDRRRISDAARLVREMFEHPDSTGRAQDAQNAIRQISERYGLEIVISEGRVDLHYAIGSRVAAEPHLLEFAKRAFAFEGGL